MHGQRREISSCVMMGTPEPSSESEDGSALAVAIAVSMIDGDNPQRRFLQALVLSDGTAQRALLLMPRFAL